jgi:hypothetical protein
MPLPLGPAWCLLPRPVSPPWRLARLACGPLAALWLGTACAPALNWREFTLPDGDGLRVQFPCKPDASERTLNWPASGQPVTVRMHRCQADGHTWVVQAIRLDTVTRVEPTLREWPPMVLANLRLAAGVAPVADLSPSLPVQVPHMTPSAHAQALDLVAGPMPVDASGQGAAAWRRVRAWHFFHGLTVFQAAVWSSDDHKPAQTSEDVTRPFFDGLHFPD